MLTGGSDTTVAFAVRVPELIRPTLVVQVGEHSQVVYRVGVATRRLQARLTSWSRKPVNRPSTSSR